MARYFHLDLNESQGVDAAVQSPERWLGGAPWAPEIKDIGPRQLGTSGPGHAGPRESLQLLWRSRTHTRPQGPAHPSQPTTGWHSTKPHTSCSFSTRPAKLMKLLSNAVQASLRFRDPQKHQGLKHQGL